VEPEGGRFQFGVGVFRQRDVRSGGADLGECHDLACAGWLDPSRGRGVLAEREARARAVVVREVRLEDRAQVGFAEDDDVVEAVAANGAMRRSANGFCQGECVAVFTSSMPSPTIRLLNAAP
jgi:hypothetical protein